MVAVDVTGRLVAPDGKPYPAARRPKLGFRPLAHTAGSGSLVPAVETYAVVDPLTGMFLAQLESIPGLRYRPFVQWVLNPGEPDPALWAMGSAEWDFDFHPGGGGAIDVLANLVPVASIAAQLTPPPVSATGMVWIDLSDVALGGALVYAPEGSF